MSDAMELWINADGTVEAVYDDTLVELFKGERMVTRRASHVEPHPTRPGWLADMRPVSGPVLGRGWYRTREAIAWSIEHEGTDGVSSLPPFLTREEALAAERQWLSDRLRAGSL